MLKKLSFPSSVDNCFVSCDVFDFLEMTENRFDFEFGEIGGFVDDASKPDFVANSSLCFVSSNTGRLTKAPGAEEGGGVIVDTSDTEEGETSALGSVVGEYPTLLLFSCCLKPMTRLLGSDGIVRAVDGDEPANPESESADEYRT